METDYQQQAWLNAAQAVDVLQGLTGMAISQRKLAKLCEAEFCAAYVDCSFAAGPAPADQLFVRLIKGAGHCELLVSGETSLRVADTPAGPLLAVAGGIIVCGKAWVYARDHQRPSREEGVWRMEVSLPGRPLHFKPADLQALATRLGEGGPATRCLQAFA